MEWKWGQWWKGAVLGLELAAVAVLHKKNFGSLRGWGGRWACNCKWPSMVTWAPVEAVGTQTGSNGSTWRGEGAGRVGRASPLLEKFRQPSRMGWRYKKIRGGAMKRAQRSV